MREIDKGGGWKVREIVDGPISDRKTFYFYKRKRARRVTLGGILPQQLAGYTLIEKDLRNILVWLGEIDKLFPPEERPQRSEISPDRDRFNIIKGLYVAALVSYAKCYSQCDGRRAQLHKKNLDAAYRDIHDDVVRQRHHYAAHSGADKFEDVRVVLVLPPKKTQQEPPQIYRELAQPDMWLPEANEITFVSLVEHAREKTLERIDRLSEKIMEEIVLPKGKDYWYKKMK